MNQFKQRDTIIFVHGAWHGKWCWDKYFRSAFIDHGYDVITFDLPGHDRPGKIKGINRYSIGDYVDAFKAQVDQLDDLPIIIAHSMGGLVLQKYLEVRTCKKAIFLASVPPRGVLSVTLKFARKLYFYPSLLMLNLFGLVNSDAKCQEAFFSHQLPKEELREYSAQLCSESFTAFINMLFMRAKVTQHSEIPILVVAAENDAIFTIEENEQTAQKYKADLIIIKDVAHDMMIDVNHEIVSQRILDWLEK